MVVTGPNRNPSTYVPYAGSSVRCTLRKAGGRGPEERESASLAPFASVVVHSHVFELGLRVRE